MRLGIGVLLVSALAFGQGSSFEKAKQLFDRANYREAVNVLAPVVSSAEATGPALQLMGKSYFMTGDFKKAAEYFERAIQLEPSNSNHHHWLGKAYGRRAETSNPFLAPGLASKARQSFEKSVDLNPKNIEAINDLFQYYLEAPGFLGGGLDKAAALSKKIEAVDPVEYHYAMAQIAERRKEFNTAEQHFRRAAELAPRQVGRVIDLARFLSKQGKVQESETLFAQAEKLAPSAPRVMFERASSYIRNKHNLPAAKALLQKYLNSPLTPDDPPRSEAEKLLKQVAGA